MSSCIILHLTRKDSATYKSEYREVVPLKTRDIILDQKQIRFEELMPEEKDVVVHVK